MQYATYVNAFPLTLAHMREEGREARPQCVGDAPITAACLSGVTHERRSYGSGCLPRGYQQNAYWDSFLGCGTGRIGQWLRQQGVSHLHGVDCSFAMARQAVTKQVYAAVCLADLTHCPLPSHTCDLGITVLTASHLPALRALYTEGARLLRPGGVFVVLDYHPFFLLWGIPTHFDRAPGESIAIVNVVHFFSDHVTSGRFVNWTLVDMQERVVDQAWVAQRPSMARYLHQPVSFALVWRGGV